MKSGSYLSEKKAEAPSDPMRSYALQNCSVSTPTFEPRKLEIRMRHNTENTVMIRGDLEIPFWERKVDRSKISKIKE